ncbi:MAG: Tex-like N-terminal domain-containing protein, partial [Candidatus Latescibacteria bacterium]|nr:Tex-like N-terminal domain-containing protein [Candidatus Latescibacterota bacterium]
MTDTEESDHFPQQIAGELNLTPAQVTATIALLDEGGTIPFIARYRKEVTGTLDEIAVTAIRDRLAQLHELNQRRATILKSLEEQGMLTDDLRQKVNAAASLSVLED